MDHPKQEVPTFLDLFTLTLGSRKRPFYLSWIYVVDAGSDLEQEVPSPLDGWSFSYFLQKSGQVLFRYEHVFLSDGK